MVQILEQLNKVFEWNTIAIMVFSAVTFLTLLSFQGFDVCDEGWYLSFYQQIYNAPETVEYNFAFWLTGIVGGIWYEIFPNGGILSFRLLAIIVITSTVIIAYQILKDYLTKPQIVIGLFMVMIVNDFGYLAFYYNHLSGLIAVSTIYFIMRGFKKNRLYLIGIAGFLAAINVLARLPNITLFAFAIIFPMQSLWVKPLVKNSWIKQSLVFGLGAVVGLLLVYVLMYFLGHLDIMNNSILGILNKGKNTDSNHNIYKLLSVYSHEYWLVLKSGIKLIIAFSILLFLRKWMHKNFILNLLWYVIGLILFIYLFKNHGIYSLYFIGLIGAIAVLFIKKINAYIKIVSFLALIMMVFLPLGSDGGINNAGYVSIWLAIPIFNWYYFQVNKLNFEIKSQNILIDENDLKKIFQIFIISFFIIKIYNISNEAYFDSGSRFNKKYTINNPLSKGIYTTKRRADIINNLLPELEKHIVENDYLLAYDNIPMVNFLTNTKPYLYISWVWVYDSDTFNYQLKRAEKEINRLPVVVQQKFQTIGYFSAPVLDYMSETKEEDYIYKKGRMVAMNSFLKRNNYKIVWSNPYFNILKPEKSTIKNENNSSF